MLANIDKWGASVGAAWAEGLAEGFAEQLLLKRVELGAAARLLARAALGAFNNPAGYLLHDPDCAVYRSRTACDCGLQQFLDGLA